jgi:hypothetical protein
VTKLVQAWRKNGRSRVPFAMGYFSSDLILLSVLGRPGVKSASDKNFPGDKLRAAHKHDKFVIGVVPNIKLKWKPVIPPPRHPPAPSEALLFVMRKLNFKSAHH